MRTHPQFDALPFLEAMRQGGPAAEHAALTLMRHYRPVLRAKLRLAGIGFEDLDDLSSEILMKVVLNAHQVRAAPAFHSWVCQICRHEIAQHWQGRSRERQLFSEAASDEDGGAERSDPGSELRRTLSLLERLPDEGASDPVLRLCLQGQLARFKRDAAQRYACIELIAMGHDAREIAELIQRSYGAAREYMSRCCAALLEYWGPCLSAEQLQSLKRGSVTAPAAHV